MVCTCTKEGLQSCSSHSTFLSHQLDYLLCMPCHIVSDKQLICAVRMD